MYSQKFENLFSPMKIGPITIPNRIVMSPMGTGHSSSDSSITQELIDFYAERAKGGVGMVITEGNLVQSDIDPFPMIFNISRIDHFKKIAKLAELADMVRYFDGVACIQLSIGMGRQAEAPWLMTPVAPSPCPAQGDPSIICRELTNEEIKKLVADTAQAAEYALAAGFQVVEIHGHTGYLLDQFLSPDINQRTDEYGGSGENRFRIVKEILDAVRAKVGQALAITLRITAEHKMEGGRTLEEGLELCRMAEEAGYDGLNVDVGRYEVMPWLFPTSYMGAAVMKDVAKAVKQQVKIPIIMVGNITRPEIAEEIIADGCADFVAIGRGLLADPEWAIKSKLDRVDEIRPCIMCNEKCIGRLNEGKGITCSVNPQCGRERTFLPTPALKSRRITVVGGGPGGMQAAITAAKRGHRVTLLEKESCLGGQLNLAEHEPFKVPIKDFNAYMQKQIASQDIDIRLNTAASPEEIAATQPDAIIAAVGADVFLPPIKGFEGPDVLTVSDLLQREVKGDETVLVVGGGLVGSETALGLALKGCKTTIIEMLPQIAGDLMFINRISLLQLLEEQNVEVLVNTKCKEIVGNNLICTDENGADISLNFDFVVAATGTKPEAKVAAEIQSSFPEVYLVGDCTKPAKIGEAVHKGYAAGLRV